VASKCWRPKRQRTYLVTEFYDGAAVDFFLRVSLAEQDEGLEALSRVVGHQKQIALDIGNEVESQNGRLAPLLYA